MLRLFLLGGEPARRARARPFFNVLKVWARCLPILWLVWANRLAAFGAEKPELFVSLFMHPRFVKEMI